MKLNHLSLAVPDVAATAAFMENYFDFTIVENKKNIIIVMEGSDDFILVLTTEREAERPYPADFHFGFFVNNDDEVNVLYDKMLKGGHERLRPPAKIRGSFGFYFYIPGNIMAEVSSKA